MSLEDKIKKLMEENSMSQKKLAEATELSQAHISRIISGAVTNATLDTLEKIGKALGVTTAYLLGEEGKGKPQYSFRGLEKLDPKGRQLVQGLIDQMTRMKRCQCGHNIKFRISKKRSCGEEVKRGRKRVIRK